MSTAIMAVKAKKPMETQVCTVCCLMNPRSSTPTATPEEADTVLEWALPMLGISPAKAKRLAHAPLPPLEIPAG